MSTRPLRIVLATDSTTPSGVGRQILAQTLAAIGGHNVIIAAPPSSGLLEDARAAKCTVQAYLCAPTRSSADWLAFIGTDVLHVHAGIGWGGAWSRRSGFASPCRPARFRPPKSYGGPAHGTSPLPADPCRTEGGAHPLVGPGGCDSLRFPSRGRHLSKPDTPRPACTSARMDRTRSDQYGPRSDP